MGDISAVRNWVLRHFTAAAVVMFDNNISTPEAGDRLYRRHQCRLVILGPGLTTCSRCRLVYGNLVGPNSMVAQTPMTTTIAASGIIRMMVLVFLVIASGFRG